MIKFEDSQNDEHEKTIVQRGRLMILPVYVISNGQIFYEVFNAIAALVGDSTFSTLIKISATFALLGVAVQYIRSQDIKIFGIWFVSYFFIVNVMLIPKATVQIIDSTVPGAVLVIDHVPMGIALPANLITGLSFAIEEKFEEVFHAPDDQSYSKTGLIFGSHLFRLSTGMKIVDSNLRTEFNDYVKNCVMGDILINHKYTLSQLYQATDIWNLVSQSPSPVRGLYIDNQFQTCRQATHPLKTALDNDINQKALIFYGQRIFGGISPDQAKALLMTYLQSSYDYYANISESAQQILTQNLLINTIQDGVNSYAAQTGSAASMLNYSSTKSLEQMRLAFATSRNLAGYTLPLLQTVMLLMLLCLFPVIILLAMQPYFGFLSLKNYFYSLVWVESWPILYAVFNIAMTYYIGNHTHNLANGGVTLSNVNPLAVEHSDLANMAGYLSTAIPFIAVGLIYGMARAFNNAANYIGGMMHSVASSGAAEAVSGNVSLGNTSLNNLSANKHDTNETHLHGLSTAQIANGATITTTMSGEGIYNTVSAMSQLPISLNAGLTLSETFSRSAEMARQSAMHDARSYNDAMSRASSQLESFGRSNNFQKNMGHHYAVNESTFADQALSNIYSMAQDYSSRENVSFNEALSYMTAYSIGVKGSAGVGIPKISPFHAGGDVNAGGSFQRNHTFGTNSDKSYSQSELDSLSSQFRHHLTVVENYANNQHYDTSHSQGASLLTQVASDFRNAQTSAKTYSADLSQSERLSEMANFSQSHAASIQTNFQQGFANYVRSIDPQHADNLLTNTSSQSVAAIREQYAQNYMNQYSKQFEKNFESLKQHVNPSQSFNAQANHLLQQGNSLSQEYATGAQKIDAQAGDIRFDSSPDLLAANQLQTTVTDYQTEASSQLGVGGQAINQRRGAQETMIDQKIGEGKKKF